MKVVQQLRYGLKFINYKLFAGHQKGHGIHSPFLFNLIIKVFNNKTIDDDLKRIFNTYNQHKKSKEIIEFEEIGTRSNFNSTRVLNPRRVSISIGRIIKTSSVNKKYGHLLYTLVKHFAPDDILELGTSVGISTSFIALAKPESTFTSIEGVPEKVEVAKKIAEELHQNTKFVIGNFDKLLDKVLDEYKKLDFVYFDGNHTKESTLTYFYACLNKIHNGTIFVFDDIHWSKGMEEAWREITDNKKVTLSVDIFRMGLIFFRKELSKEHYIIKF